MNILSISDQAIADAASFICKGGIVIHPTETCYGIACDLTNREAVRKMFIVKNRPMNQPVSALFPSIEASQEYVLWPERALEIGKKYLPGPLTIILPVVPRHQSDLFPSVDHSSDVMTLGIRISSHPIAMKISEYAGIPISTTSANVHGKSEPYSLEDITSQYSEGALEPVWMLNSGVLPLAKPSTIVSIKNDTMTLVREGSVRIE
jgi:L-threonylcarbamoyladenylate synthase